MARPDYEESTASFIHDSNHEQILLNRNQSFSPMKAALRTGDAEMLWEIMSELNESIHEVNRRYTPEEENQYQTFARLISINTILNMAARESGVHALYLHTLSRRFDKRIAKCPVEQESVLMKDMIDGYCKMIRHASVERYGEFSDQIIEILLSSLTDPPSLEELAGRMYVSPATVSRRFKAETGFTIPEFLNRARVRLAQLRIQEENASLSEIAQAVGFCDASYFSKVFLRYTGVTPSEYAKQISRSRTEK